MTPTSDRRQAIRAELALCRSDPARFNATVLGRGRYWRRQRDLCRSVVESPVTLCPAGNSVGKSYCLAGMILWFLTMHPGCRVLATAPSQVQLEQVLWKNVEAAYRGARVPIGGRTLRSPLKVDLGGGWDVLAYSTTKTERLSGHHREDLLVVVDEGSGVDDPIWEALDSCNPSRFVVMGNPLRPTGQFYERCRRADLRAGEGRPDPLVRLHRISSLESPDIGLPRSPRGMADATWLAKARNDYGEGSAWWKSHVLAEFPDSAADQLIPRDWLDLAGKARHVPRGPRRLAIDLAEGGGGDRTVLLVRDDNGLLEVRHSNRWGFADAARQAAELVARHGIDPRHVTWDANGSGFGFLAYLEAAGIKGARGYKGGTDGGPHFDKLKAKAAFALRHRLDPARKVAGPVGVLALQVPFAIPAGVLALLRPELQAIRYRNVNERQVGLEKAELLKAALGHSPDFADALVQSFAW